jgi:hypothetical protein
MTAGLYIYYIDYVSILEDYFLIVKSLPLYICPLFLSCIIQLKRKEIKKVYVCGERKY